MFRGWRSYDKPASRKASKSFEVNTRILLHSNGAPPKENAFPVVRICFWVECVRCFPTQQQTRCTAVDFKSRSIISKAIHLFGIKRIMQHAASLHDATDKKHIETHIEFSSRDWSIECFREPPLVATVESSPLPLWEQLSCKDENLDQGWRVEEL